MLMKKGPTDLVVDFLLEQHHFLPEERAQEVEHMCPTKETAEPRVVVRKVLRGGEGAPSLRVDFFVVQPCIGFVRKIL